MANKTATKTIAKKASKQTASKTDAKKATAKKATKTVAKKAAKTVAKTIQQTAKGAPKVYIGQRLFLAAGTRYTRAGFSGARTRGGMITVRSVSPARNGKTRVFWKSHGYQASALI